MSALDARSLLSPGAGDPGGGVRVYCFAHAGGDPRSFLAWQPLIGDAATLVAVGRPGRGRLSELPAPAGVAEFAEAAARAIARDGAGPAVLFGHSLGALTAFETARALAPTGRVRALVASGCNAPPLLPTPRVRAAARLEGRAFAEAVGFFGGLPPEILDNDDLLALLLPAVQADFRMVAGYAYRPAPPLECALTLVNGRDDAHVGAEGLAPWRAQCAGPTEEHWCEGGHFYFDGAPDALAALLRAAADRAAAGDARHVEMI